MTRPRPGSRRTPLRRPPSARSACAIAGLACLAAMLTLLAGCENRRPGPFERIIEVSRSALGGAPAPPARAPAAAAIAPLGDAAVAVSFQGGPRAVVPAYADNGGYVDYRDSAGQGIVMLGNAVVRTLAFGDDLEGVRFDPADPVAHPRAPDQWPDALWREYRFRVRDGAPYSVVLRCTYLRVGRERITIFERVHDVVRMVETCANARREVVNTYWVEEGTGFAWKSEQWVGPARPPITIEVVRPNTPSG